MLEPGTRRKPKAIGDGEGRRQEGLTAEYAEYAEKQTSSQFPFRVFRVFCGSLLCALSLWSTP